MGERGLRQVNEQSYQAAHYLHDRLIEQGLAEDIFSAPFLNEFTVRVNGDARKMRMRAAEQGFLLGVETEGCDNCLTICATEMCSKADIDTLLDSVTL